MKPNERKLKMDQTTWFKTLSELNAKAESYGLPLEDFLRILPAESWLYPYNEVVADLCSFVA
jgi:hypothetical protein